jgi:hypothetical protein
VIFEDPTPASLDAIVRRHRDRIAIGLATLDEIAGRSGAVEQGEERDTIDAWRVISIRAPAEQPGGPILVLLGQAVSKRHAWVTSDVRVLDVARGLCLTQNSLYRLVHPGEGEPPADDLRCLCAGLWEWGIGKIIDAPQFYY